MAIIDAGDAEIHVATTAGGTYHLIQQAHQFNDRRGAQSGQSFRLFGTDTRITEAGANDGTLTVNMLTDLADTNGQAIVRAAFESGDTVYLRILLDGGNGRQQAATVTGYEDSGDANGSGLGKYVAAVATFTFSGASSAVTAG